MRDHLIVLSEPAKKPDRMSQYEYDQAPPTLKVREIEAGGKIMVTTFVCPKETPKHVLKALYRQRWNVELDLRNIKTTLGWSSCVAGPRRWPSKSCGFICWPTI